MLAEFPANLAAERLSFWMQHLTAYGALVHYGPVKVGGLCVDPQRLRQAWDWRRSRLCGMRDDDAAMKLLCLALKKYYQGLENEHAGNASLR